jgi:hypothetical protein
MKKIFEIPGFSMALGLAIGLSVTYFLQMDYKETYRHGYQSGTNIGWETGFMEGMKLGNDWGIEQCVSIVGHRKPQIPTHPRVDFSIETNGLLKGVFKELTPSRAQPRR